IVSGARIDERSGAGVEYGGERGDEERFRVLPRDLGSDLAQHLADVASAPQRRALAQRLAHRHEDARRKPLSGYVTHDEEHAIAVEHEEIVQIAADFARRLHPRKQLEAALAWEDGLGPGQHAELDAAGC